MVMIFRIMMLQQQQQQQHQRIQIRSGSHCQQHHIQWTLAILTRMTILNFFSFAPRSTTNPPQIGYCPCFTHTTYIHRSHRCWWAFSAVGAREGLLDTSRLATLPSEYNTFLLRFCLPFTIVDNHWHSHNVVMIHNAHYHHYLHPPKV